VLELLTPSPSAHPGSGVGDRLGRAEHGAGETRISGGDRIVAGPGTGHRGVMADHGPCSHGLQCRIEGTVVPEQWCRAQERAAAREHVSRRTQGTHAGLVVA
jgi:hypothetical protein